MLLQVNKFGNVDCRGHLPEGCVHVPGKRLQPLCRKLGIVFAEALVDFKKKRGVFKPVLDGVVIESKDEAALRAKLVLRAARRRDPERAKELRQSRITANFAEAIRTKFPSMPDECVRRCAAHTTEIGRGRAGRSCAWLADPVRAAVVAYARHNHTDYDDYFEQGLERDEARDEVAQEVRELLETWAKPKA